MRKRLDIVIVLLMVIIVLMCIMMTTGCSSLNGLHSNNIGRNTAAKHAMQLDKDYKFVR